MICYLAIAAWIILGLWLMGKTLTEGLWMTHTGLAAFLFFIGGPTIGPILGAWLWYMQSRNERKRKRSAS